ncbi:ubinuclein-2 [Aphelenchoides avenae]|nr:ubinuclein-2 [Aphelenchus avenae]
MLSVESTKAKKKASKDPESMECTCVIFPFVPPTDDSYMEIDWPTVKKKYNIQDGYSDDTEDSEDEDERRIATNLKSMTVTGKKGGKKVKVRAKKSDFYDLGQGYVNEDGFIDDSEQYDEYVPSYLDTEYGGFYINEGPVEFRETDDAVQDAEDEEGHAGDDGTSNDSSSTDSDDSSSDGSTTDKDDEAADEPAKKHRKKKEKAVRSEEINDGDDGIAAKPKDDTIESMEADGAKKDKHQPEEDGKDQISSSDESDGTTMTETTVTDEEQQPGAESVKPPRLAGMPPTARLVGMPPGARMPPAARLAGMPPTSRLAGAPPTARLAGQPPRMKAVKKKVLKTSEKETQRVKNPVDGKATAKPKPSEEWSRSDVVASLEDAKKKNADDGALKSPASKPTEKPAASADIDGTQQEPSRSDVATTSTKQPNVQTQQVAEAQPEAKKQVVTDLSKAADRPTPFTHMFSAAVLSKPSEKVTVPASANKPEQTAATDALRRAHAAAVQAEQTAQKSVGASLQTAKPSANTVVSEKTADGPKSLPSESPPDSCSQKASLSLTATHRQGGSTQAPAVIDLTRESASHSAAKAIQRKSQFGGFDTREQYMRSLVAQQYKKDVANAQLSAAACAKARSSASSSSGNEDPSEVFSQYFAQAVPNKAQVTKPPVARTKPPETRPQASSSQSSAASPTITRPATKQSVAQVDLAAVLAQYGRPSQGVEQFRLRFQTRGPPTAQQVEQRTGPTAQSQKGSPGAVSKPTSSTSSSIKPDTSKNPPDVVDIE